MTETEVWLVLMLRGQYVTALIRILLRGPRVRERHRSPLPPPYQLDRSSYHCSVTVHNPDQRQWGGPSTGTLNAPERGGNSTIIDRYQYAPDRSSTCSRTEPSSLDFVPYLEPNPPGSHRAILSVKIC